MTLFFFLKLVIQTVFFVGKECFGMVKSLFNLSKVKLKMPSTIKKSEDHFLWLCVKGHFCSDMIGGVELTFKHIALFCCCSITLMHRSTIVTFE